MRYRYRKIPVLVFSCMVVLLTGVPSVEGQSDHTARLIEGAKKEGKLVWYTAMTASDSKLILDAFKVHYPFVETELFRASGDRIRNRIMTEAAAGREQFDAVSIGGIDILAEQNLLSAYVSPEANFYISEFKDAAGYWTAIYNLYYVIGYNTQLVSQSEAPKDWKDLLDPKWRGKIGIDREEYPWYATLVASWGKAKAQTYMQALAKQDIQWRNGHTLIAQLMTAGEFPLAIVYAHRAEEMKGKGAPIQWVNTLDPIVVSAHGIGLSAKPRNPNTAKLFIDFILSRKTQEMIRSFKRIPARLDVEPLSPMLDQAQLKLKIVPADMGSRYNEYVQEFRSFFGL